MSIYHIHHYEWSAELGFEPKLRGPQPHVLAVKHYSLTKMVPPLGIEPSPHALQAHVHTSYTRAANGTSGEFRNPDIHDVNVTLCL